jgi:hypothetical protein
MSCPHCRRTPTTTAAVMDAPAGVSPAAPAAGPSASAPRTSIDVTWGSPRKSRIPVFRRSHMAIFRRGAGKAGWVVPGILLVLVPKCPLCLAAYIALATGVSISAATATWLRWLLIVFCVGALGWLVARWSLYLYRRVIR